MNKKQGVTIIIFFIFCMNAAFSQTNIFTIDAKNVVGENTEFWKAAGSDHLFYHTLKPSGQALLNRMEQHKSHNYLRSHHTFKQDMKNGVLRGQNVYSEDKNGKAVYDFSNVNKVYKEYVKRGIKPIVEYDYIPELLELKGDLNEVGNDEGMTMRNTGPSDWKKWSDLMKAATHNFIDVFGKEEVRSWYFEVWNEPDGWPIEELHVFYKMYDVFVDAVTSVDKELRVGGPACYHEYFLRPFLNHVTNGTNYVTGKKGTQIDFISYHIYGLSGKWLNTEPHIQPLVERFSQSVLWLKRLMKEFPQLKGTEFHINEWGMSSNYYRTVKDYPDLKYRNNEESPLFLVKLVNSLYQIEDNYNFPTSLLLYWGFSWEADEDEFFVGKRELTTAGDIPKPIQTGFEMLAKLDEQRLKVERQKKDNRLGVLATKASSGQISLIAYNYVEGEKEIKETDELVMNFKGLKPNTSYQFIETSIDRTNNNTYASWKEMGEPATSEDIDLLPLQKAGQLTPTGHGDFNTNKKGESQLKLNLQRHSMRLIQIKEK